MSFPGHLRSLNLVNDRNHKSRNILENNHIEAPVAPVKRAIVRSFSDDYNNLQTTNRSTVEDEFIIDEKGNGPTRSLWVGNIPPRTTSSELRILFGKFGTIVSTKPQAKYAFVNFELLESAIAAWRQCHDQDIFNTGYSTINIRFTSSLAEAKHAKDEHERKSSIALNAEAAHKQWFQPVDNSNITTVLKSPDIDQWPNGKPPSGPKSQRCGISPPPLRRGESYRPNKHAESYRSESDYKRTENETYRRGRDYYRRTDQYYSPAYSPDGSQSPYETASSPGSPRYKKRSRRSSSGDESPLPWERRRVDAHTSNIGRSEQQRKAGHMRESRPSSEMLAAGLLENKVERQGIFNGSVDAMELRGSPPAFCLRVPDEGSREDGEHSPNLYGLEGASVGELEVPISLAPVLQPVQSSKSPSLRPIERLRGASNTIRGSSVHSEAPTSSSKASTRKRRCNDCRKAGSDLSPLVSCCKCVRRFHSCCGDPKPSSCIDKSMFICGRCQREAGAPSTVVSVAVSSAETKPLATFGGKAHLISPPLSLSYDGEGSTNLSPRDGFLYALSDTKNLEPFFPPSTAIDGLPESGASQISPKTSYDTKIWTPSIGDHVKIRSIPTLNNMQRSDAESAEEKRHKYKAVTCKWWASGNCTQTEEGCYYSHSHTNLLFPDRKRVNKDWTCYDWLHSLCPVEEWNCLHAHHDTGLHIWRDGRPSFKHVTCFWWCKGRCKWDMDSCKFAHEDTGLYSLDPADKWQGGCKFTTVNPADEPGPFDHAHRATGLGFSFTGQSMNDKQQHSREVPNIIPASGQDTTSMNIEMKSSSLEVTNHSNALKSKQCRNEFDLRQSIRPVGSAAHPFLEDSHHKTSFRNADVLASKLAYTSIDLNLPMPMIENGEMSECNDYGNGTGPRPLQHSDSTNHTVVEEESAVAHSSYHSTSVVSDGDRNYDAMELDSVDNEQSHATKDPRLQRSHPMFDHHKRAAQCTTGLIDLGEESSGDHMQTVKHINDSKDIVNDDPARRGVKKCQICFKPVFGTDICRVCSGRRESCNADKSSTGTPAKPVSAVVECGADTVPSNARPSTTRELEELTKGDTKSSPAPKNILKRCASGTNIFLKNKRPKGSMMFSSSGSIRPDAFTNQPVERRPRLNSINQDSRKQPQSLQDLIRNERQKNTKKLPELALDIRPVRSPTKESEKENETPDSAERQLSSEIDVLVTTRSTNQSEQNNTTHRTRILTGEELFSSPQQSPIRNPAMPTESPVKAKRKLDPNSDVKINKESIERSPTKLSHKHDNAQSRWKSPNSAESFVELETNSSGASIDRLNSKRLPFKRRLSSEQGGTTRLHSYVRDDEVNRHDFTWASPITCTRCQKNHKKCLHDSDGTLSAVKCREYVLSRKGKPDSGRSRQDWNAILEASELEPNSEDDSSDAEDSVTTDNLVSSDTDEDFATAVGGDEVSVDQERKENMEPVEPARKPVLQIILPPKKDHVSVTTDLSTGENGSWTATDEGSTKMKTTRGGLMFESESEDEDYLSDEYEIQVLRKRPIDPLYVNPKISKDLFEVAPELDLDRILQDMEISRTIQARPSRKQQWKDLCSQRLQERRERFGNPHWEVDRQHPDVMVTALVERIVPPKNTDDRFAVGSVQVREEKISFADFLGAPKLPEICLMNDGERLAFRDGQKERDRTFGRTGRGLGKLTTDEEKWQVRLK